MNIGDKVRFLSEVGGGVVSGFQGKDIVLVEDEDGFDIPMPISQVVVIDTDDYNIAKVNTLDVGGSSRSKAAKPAKPVDDDEAWLERPVTFRAKPQERHDGDKLNLMLAFVPVDSRSLTTTAFRAYMVNDSNYYISFVYMAAQNNSWQARYQGTAEPNTKVMMEEFFISDLADIERVTIQAFAYKVDRPYQRKQPISVERRIDGTKFYRINTFRHTPFFKDDALLLELVKDDESSPIQLSQGEPEAQNPPTTGKSSLPRSGGNDSATGKSSLPLRGEPEGAAGTAGDAPLIVDLHIRELLDDTRGLTPADLLRVQLKEVHRVMDENKGRRGQRIVFIHGKGEGVLRAALLKELSYRYKGCTVQDASFREYGYGATQVTL